MAREPLPEFAKFQLTPSRRATDCQIITYEQVIISTHALTEGDVVPQSRPEWTIFQLTPSRRATFTGSVLITSVPFQLTPSRRATTGEKIILC